MTATRSSPALTRLEALHPKVIDLSLDRTTRLLAALGHPQDKLAPVVHVAGTNGKGSVIAYMRTMLEAAGLRVHVYTSPHLVRFHERIRLSGEEICEDTLADILEEVERVNGNKPITFFEATTASAFLAMSRTPADVVLLETGLGGRLDATNVIAHPALTILTPIAMDHEEFLGANIELIAAEKAHILKAGAGCVMARQTHAVDRVVEQRRSDLGVPLWKEGRDWQARPTPHGMIFDGRHGTLDLPKPALIGDHQVHNAALALAAIESLEMIDVPTDAKAAGLKTVHWPGRLQRLTTGPAGPIPDGFEIWLDGGHNPAAAEVLAQVCRSWKGKSLHLVLGMMADKNPRGFLKPFGSQIQSLYAVPVPGEPRAATPETLCQAAKAEGVLSARTSASVTSAIKTITAEAPGPGIILIAGSLYLAGAVLANITRTP